MPAPGLTGPTDHRLAEGSHVSLAPQPSRRGAAHPRTDLSRSTVSQVAPHDTALGAYTARDWAEMALPNAAHTPALHLPTESPATIPYVCDSVIHSV
jgi:hypothetical protein